jgi:hypothetical protein
MRTLDGSQYGRLEQLVQDTSVEAVREGLDAIARARAGATRPPAPVPPRALPGPVPPARGRGPV